jgi:spore germination cell wall hydrolase CwlJ-like protein
MINTSTVGTYVIAALLANSEPLEVPINDYFCLVEAIHYEANGEGYRGKQVVANVIQNRMDRVEKWDSWCTTIHYGGQFTYNKGLRVNLSKPADRASFKETARIAYLAVQGKLADITNGADHYYNPDKIARVQDWMKKGIQLGKVGHHVILRLIDDNGHWTL